jgi:hypothetical protein
LDEGLRTVKFIEMESRMVVAGAGREEGIYHFTCMEFHLGKVKTSWK